MFYWLVISSADFSTPVFTVLLCHLDTSLCSDHNWNMKKLQYNEQEAERFTLGTSPFCL